MEKIAIKMKNLTFTGASLILILCLTACKKQAEVLPGETENVACNFYVSSDVMSTAYSPVQATLAAYVDKFQEQATQVFASTSNKFPYFSFGFRGGLEYPAGNTALNDGSINYVRYDAGNHRLFFTDINNTVVLDTTIYTKPKTFCDLYLADEITPADAPAKYKLVMAEEDRKATAEKTGIRFIHLSADAGKLTCNIRKANGDLSAVQAGELAFGQVSDYQFFGSDDVASGGLLRFTLSNTTNGINFTTGVPFNPGRNYVIVILGFHTDQQRLVATGKNADNSIKNELITIPNNLRAEIRRSY